MPRYIEQVMIDATRVVPIKTVTNNILAQSILKLMHPPMLPTDVPSSSKR